MAAYVLNLFMAYALVEQTLIGYLSRTNLIWTVNVSRFVYLNLAVYLSGALFGILTVYFMARIIQIQKARKFGEVVKFED